MNITILSVTKEELPNKNGSGTYTKASVAYKDADGKVTGKNLVSFANKNVFEILSNAQAGDTFDVVNEKIGNNWNWTSAKAAVAGAPSVVPSPKAGGSGAGYGKSTYPTNDERAKTQVYIARQSSLKHAIEFAVASKTTVRTPVDVIVLAREFEAYVMGEMDAPLADLSDDIPS